MRRDLPKDCGGREEGKGSILMIDPLDKVKEAKGQNFGEYPNTCVGKRGN